ncbi:hypothetical protein Glove_337g8 [Diversispora epigaea]|uniref:Uncharacterized protein n=1 Tax=Diversispora epigaea TaxID=1348612 RepID=A0A397HIB3_9GLOM|nr:hypothetical protein Glove_337g8 [Diversispora epigaea]
MKHEQGRLQVATTTLELNNKRGIYKFGSTVTTGFRAHSARCLKGRTHIEKLVLRAKRNRGLNRRRVGMKGYRLKLKGIDVGSIKECNVEGELLAGSQVISESLRGLIEAPFLRYPVIGLVAGS